MVELLAVLAIVGILAAAAAPVFVRTMRDGRVGSSAHHIAEFYRTARSRALGRGACVMVRFDDAETVPTAADPAGHLTMREAIMGGGVANCAPGPSPSCITTDWADASTNSRFITSFDERAPQFTPAAAEAFTVAGVATGFAEVAFTPRGRTFVRYKSTDAFLPLRGVLRIEVENATTTFVRQVVVPPTGAARVITRM